MISAIINKKELFMPVVPLTPQQIQLEKDLQLTPTIIHLVDNQEQIIKMVKEEKEQNTASFEKSNQKFSKIESEISELREEVSEMKTQIADGFKQISGEINLHIIKSNEDEITKLNTKLDRTAQVKDGIIVTLVGGILLAIATVIIYSAVAPPEMLASLVR